MGLSIFQLSHTIGTPEDYGQRKIHAPICNFIASSKYGQISTSTQLTRIIHQKKIWRETRELSMEQVQNRYYLFIQGDINR